MSNVRTVLFFGFFSFIIFNEGREIKQLSCLAAIGVDSFTASKTNFFLWTRRNAVLFQELFIDNVAVLDVSNYVRTNPTKIYVHGFAKNGITDLSLKLRKQFLETEDCNFISIDWAFLALPPDYATAASNTIPVGTMTGCFVNFLISQNADLSKIHLIGFSMGAHIVGRAGALTNGIIPRITGLDPAFPQFNYSNDQNVLEKTDARFVDIIHTNAGNLEDRRIGVPFSIGHADFWPNGGSSQPGCMVVGTGEGVIPNIVQLFFEGTCSHLRAVEYFIESIDGAIPFLSTQCGSYQEFKFGFCSQNSKTQMGMFVSTSAAGNFFLDTNAAGASILM